MSGYHPHDVIVVIVAGPIRAVVGQESAKHHSITGLEDCVPDLLQRRPRFSTRSAGDVVVTCLLAQDAICSKPPRLLVAGRGGESGSFQDPRGPLYQPVVKINPAPRININQSRMCQVRCIRRFPSRELGGTSKHQSRSPFDPIKLRRSHGRNHPVGV